MVGWFIVVVFIYVVVLSVEYNLYSLLYCILFPLFLYIVIFVIKKKSQSMVHKDICFAPFTQNCFDPTGLTNLIIKLNEIS